MNPWGLLLLVPLVPAWALSEWLYRRNSIGAAIAIPVSYLLTVAAVMGMIWFTFVQPHTAP